MEHLRRHPISRRARFYIALIIATILILAGVGIYVVTRPPLGISLFQAVDISLPQVRSWAEDAVLIAATGIETRSGVGVHFKGEDVLVPSSPQIGDGLPTYWVLTFYSLEKGEGLGAAILEGKLLGMATALIPAEEAQPAAGRDVIDSTQVTQVVRAAIDGSSFSESIDKAVHALYRLGATYEERELRWTVILTGPDLSFSLVAVVDPILGMVMSLEYHSI
ncbi:MAG: hypothetical protein ACE5HJ_04605 [Thermoplasmata archaeon]